MILLIDNYDSFTEPLPVFLRAGAEVVVRRNDEIALDDIDALAPQKIVISPGPYPVGVRHLAGGNPTLCGQTADSGRLPGHRAIAQVFGATIVRAAKVMHGKTSPITHTGTGAFPG